MTRRRIRCVWCGTDAPAPDPPAHPACPRCARRAARRTKAEKTMTARRLDAVANQHDTRGALADHAHAIADGAYWRAVAQACRTEAARLRKEIE